MKIFKEEDCYWMFLFRQAIHKYGSLKECCQNTVDKISDDEIFCLAENELIAMWYQEIGFTPKDYKYAISCGYEDSWYCIDYQEKYRV